MSNEWIMRSVAASCKCVRNHSIFRMCGVMLISAYVGVSFNPQNSMKFGLGNAIICIIATNRAWTIERDSRIDSKHYIWHYTSTHIARLIQRQTHKLSGHITLATIIIRRIKSNAHTYHMYQARIAFYEEFIKSAGSI